MGFSDKVLRSKKMKRQLSISIAAIFMAASLLVSCGSTITPSALGAKGGVTVKVQATSAAIQDVFAAMKRTAGLHPLDHPAATIAGKALSSKAFMGAGLIRFSVLGLNGNTADSWSMTPYESTMGSVSFQDSRILPAGSYTLYASVYNSAGDANPAVTGSQTFQVNAGQDATTHIVNVTCFPFMPSSIVEGPASGTFSLPVAWYVSGTTVYSIGSEKWFTLNPSTGLTDFSAVPDSSNPSLVVVLFDDSGNLVASASNSGPGTAATISAQTTKAGALYYMAAIDLNTSSPGGAFHIKYGPYVAPATALPVGSALYYPSSLTPNQVTWYSFPTILGHTYYLNWDDSFCGSGAYSADIWVEAYQSDKSTPISMYSFDSGWIGDTYYQYGTYYSIHVDNTTKIIAASNSTTYVKVREYYPGTSYGSYAIQVRDMGLNSSNHAPYQPMLYSPNNYSSQSILPSNVYFNWWGNDQDGDLLTYTLWTSTNSGAAWTSYSAGPVSYTHLTLPTIYSV